MLQIPDGRDLAVFDYFKATEVKLQKADTLYKLVPLTRNNFLRWKQKKTVAIGLEKNTRSELLDSILVQEKMSYMLRIARWLISEKIKCHKWKWR